MTIMFDPPPPLKNPGYAPEGSINFTSFWKSDDLAYTFLVFQIFIKNVTEKTRKDYKQSEQICSLSIFVFFS